MVKALEDRFAPPNQTDLYRVQLRERRQKASETLSELGQDIRRLTNSAYPTAPCDLRETLAIEQFVDALINSEMRLHIKQSRPQNSSDVVRYALELEAFNRAERQQMEAQGYTRSTAEKVSEQKNNIEEELKSLQKKVLICTMALRDGKDKALEDQIPHKRQVMTIKQQEMLDLNQSVLYVGQKST